MKASPWLFVGGVAAGLAGLAFLLAGLFQPGQVPPLEVLGGAGKPLLAEVKKKAAAIQTDRATSRKESEGLTGFSGKEGEHRVFVSGQLVYLPQNPEPVQVLDRRMKTEDGIEVGWKMKFGFDPADPRVMDEDPDGDGFTNLEEFTGQPPTAPTN